MVLKNIEINDLCGKEFRGNIGQTGNAYVWKIKLEILFQKLNLYFKYYLYNLYIVNDSKRFCKNSFNLYLKKKNFKN